MPEWLHPHSTSNIAPVFTLWVSLTVVWARQALNKPAYRQTYTPARRTPLAENTLPT